MATSTKNYVPTREERDVLDEVMKRWEEAKGPHAAFVRHYEKGERAYRGVLEAASDAAKWRHKMDPPLAFNLIETIVSNTVEMGLRFDVRPSPRVNLPLGEAIRHLTQAEAVGDLLRHEHRVDEMDFKQRPLFLTSAIGGRGVGKEYWNLLEGPVRRQGVKNVPIEDDDGNVQLTVPVLTEIQEEGVLRDHSTFEVVDPRDFILHESAKALQPYEPGGAQYLFHRCWYSIEQLRMQERAGFLKNVDYVQEQRDSTSEHTDRSTEVFQQNTTKDLIQVLEYWCMKDGLVHRALVAPDQKVFLRDLEDSPFWHGEYPFVVCSSMPQPFSTIGVSDIELVSKLQSMLWELMNQRLDNVELINNFILLVRDDLEDLDGWDAYPGARWPVSGDPQKSVQALQPPYQLAEVTMHAEQLVRGDMQNVTSAVPFASGTETATVDQKTATGASIVMNAAQQRLVAKKYQAQQALRQEANMRIKNCQQFISDTRLVHVLGQDGAMAFRELGPLDIQGDFVAELEPMGESQMRQERRAEASQFFQVAMSAVPIAAAASVPMNVKELFGWMAKKWGIDDWERFFSQQPASMGAMGVGPGGAPSPPGDPQGAMQPNLGITSDAAVDASSPSAAGGISMSPAVALQRALAMGGSPRGG